MSAPLRGRTLGLQACHTCGLVCQPESPGEVHCPRCGSALHVRKQHSLARAWAFLLAGLICYIPANVLPVMRTTNFGRPDDSTIMSGVVGFWHEGAWDIALIIFVASIAVPCLKFLVMGVLLMAAQQSSPAARRERARLYRLVELVGYWSMLDVLVVALVCALVQFRALGSMTPQVGIFFFGMVVVFTMLSAMSFDPRLTWDDGTSPEDGHD